MTRPASERIVITGLGAVLPTGDTVEEFWAHAAEGRTAISEYKSDFSTSLLIKRFGRVSAGLTEAAKRGVPHKLHRYCTESSLWGLKAAGDALRDAGVEQAAIPEERRGLFAGQGDYMYTSLPSFSRGLFAAKARGEYDLTRFCSEVVQKRGVDPFIAIKGLSNNLLAVLSIAFGLRGDSAAFGQNECAAISALRASMLSLRQRHSDLALVVCSGSFDEVYTLAERHGLEHLSSCAHGDQSLRSFDQRRDGSILGEGAVAFVLERAADAERRGAAAVAELAAVASCTRSRRAGPSFNPYTHCLSRVLRDAAQTEEIDLIVADGKGTQAHDLREAHELEEALGTSVERTPVTCVRPIVGCLSAASVPADMLAGIRALREQQVAPIANLKAPLESRLRFVKGEAIPARVTSAACMSTGFSELYSAVLLRSAAFH